MKLLLLFIPIFLSSISGAMEPDPSQSQSSCLAPPIFLSIKVKFDHEKSKFEKYDMENNPQKVVTLLSGQLKKEEKLLKYAQELQIFASKLFWQDFYIQKLAVIRHLFQIIEQWKLINNTFKTYIHIPLTGEITLLPQTNEQLNEILTHFALVRKREIYNADEVKILESWIQDLDKGIWLNTWGIILLLNNEILEALNKRESLERQAMFLFSPLNNFYKTGSSSRIIKENIEDMMRILNNMITLEEKGLKIKQIKKQEELVIKSIEAIEDDYIKEEEDIVALYSATHHWYQSLYKIVYNELRKTITELLRKDPGNKTLMAHLSLIPYIKFPGIPASLPAQLPPLSAPELELPLNSRAIFLHNEFVDKLNAQLLEKEKNKEEQSKLKKQQRQAKAATKKIKESSIDKSYLIQNEETDKNITIHDPKNKTKVVLFKSQKTNIVPAKVPPINYTDWVKMWFDNPHKALQQQGYLDPKNVKFTSPSKEWFPIAIHSFPLLVDDFINQWATMSTIPSRKNPARKDLVITIPGMMIYPDQTKETGVFAYLIDSNNGEWYHRMFEPQSGTKLISDLFTQGYFSPQMEGYYEVFFPPLKK